MRQMTLALFFDDSDVFQGYKKFIYFIFKFVVLNSLVSYKNNVHAHLANFYKNKNKYNDATLCNKSGNLIDMIMTCYTIIIYRDDVTNGNLINLILNFVINTI